MKIRWKLLTFPILWGAVFSPLPTSGKTAVKPKVDHIVVLKLKRELELWSKDVLVKNIAFRLVVLLCLARGYRAITELLTAST